MNTALIVGCGDIGQRIARRLMAQGLAVTGLVRSAETAAQLSALRITPVQSGLDPAQPLPDCTMQRWDAVYWCAPPPNAGESDPHLAAVLARLPPPARGLLYISTTAVYGDCSGRWIDEAEPLKPGSARGRRRLAAELSLRAWAARSAAKTICLRVPGIYGPGRLPLERLRRGEPILRLQDSPYTNRIHADDLAEAALIALQHGTAGGTYNVSDEQPTTMSDYLLRCARLLSLPAPEQLPMAEARLRFSPMLLSFLEESKRLRASRLRALGWAPQYPNLQAGLPQCL